MKQRQLAFVAATALALSLVSGCAVADDGYGYYMSRHPNIEAADFNAQQAIERMRAAQRANGYDMGGHAGRAIALMQQARAEMQISAEMATR
ncbi:hypothetical protein [Paraburkholderia sediminicola]|uniref:hypothetical protein n=1 Tax=Paraburkholderia sediminicola TaxID=458836 RepID=UPI0038BA8B36